jgi:hypothetical protein
MNQPKTILLACLGVMVLSATACDKPKPASGKESVQAVYSKATGKLEQLVYDSNQDGKPDAWGIMDGSRLLRMEIDTDFNGVIDRWEYYLADGRLEKVGMSRQKDGRVDAWAFQAPDGSLGRVEISTRRDGKVTRWETYAKGALVSAEEDSDGDGRADRWETYENGAITSVAMDTQKTGKPDKKLVYRPTGVTVEQVK